MQTDTKYTQGPWTTANLDWKPHWRAGQWTIDGANADGDSPFCAYGDSYGECQANAKLIAACPELVEALKICERFVADMNLAAYQNDGDRRWTRTDAIDAVRTALAKAGVA